MREVKIRFMAKEPGLDPEYSFAHLEKKYFGTLRTHIVKEMDVQPGETIKILPHSAAIYGNYHSLGRNGMSKLKENFYQCIYLWSQNVEGFDLHECDPY